MINLRTLLSTFDEKGTLLKWLKKVEAALANASLETVQVVVVDATHIKMKFVFADGTFVESQSITLPRGPKGDTGEQGAQGPQGPQGEAGIVSLESLIALLEGSDYISVDLNEQETKVKIELDLTMLDDEPTEDSDNLVKSGGVYDAIHGLTADDIVAENTQTVQENLERIDLEVEGLTDDVADLESGKLDASKNAVATVGGLVTPTAVLSNNELVGVGVNGEQVRVQLGNGLTLSGTTSPYTLSASGGGDSGTQLYMHNWHKTSFPPSTTSYRFINNISDTFYVPSQMMDHIGAWIESLETVEGELVAIKRTILKIDQMGAYTTIDGNGDIPITGYVDTVTPYGIDIVTELG